jgi:hypothetical protein
MKIERRELFPILGASVLSAQHEHHRVAKVSSAEYKLRVLSAEQNRILDALTDIILPTDERAPGASAARVSQYLDLAASYQEPLRDGLMRGLAALDQVARREEGKALGELDRGGLTRVLEIAARNEGAPTDEAERFFEVLKFHTVEGYRFSHIGQMQWIGYRPHEYGKLYPDEAVK